MLLLLRRRGLFLDRRGSDSLLGRLGRLRLQDLLDDLLLLDQERADNAVADALGAAGAAIGARHGLLVLAEALVLGRAQARQSYTR